MIDTIDLSAADPRERGRQYGEAAREQIAASVAFYAESIAHKTGLAWSDVLGRAAVWVPIMEGYLPEIVPELRGIADGSGRTFEEIVALNSRGELTRGNPFEAKDDDEGCTSFAVLPQANALGHTWAGQNWDLWDGVADTLVVLRIAQPGKPTIICHVEAGQVGRHGANSAGIALNANGLGAGFGGGPGVPGALVRRKVLESWDFHDALKAVFDARQSLSSNLLLTHRDGFAIDVETTPAGTAGCTRRTGCWFTATTSRRSSRRRSRTPTARSRSTRSTVCRASRRACTGSAATAAPTKRSAPSCAPR